MNAYYTEHVLNISSKNEIKTFSEKFPGFVNKSFVFTGNKANNLVLNVGRRREQEQFVEPLLFVKLSHFSEVPFSTKQSQKLLEENAAKRSYY